MNYLVFFGYEISKQEWNAAPRNEDTQDYFIDPELLSTEESNYFGIIAFQSNGPLNPYQDLNYIYISDKQIDMIAGAFYSFHDVLNPIHVIRVVYENGIIKKEIQC